MISIVYSDEALKDLEDIYSYIAFALKEKDIASKIIRNIRSDARSLDPFIEMYSLVEWEPWHSAGVRRMLVGNYSVYYLPDKEANKISVIRILYSGRDIEEIIKNSNY